MATIDHRRAVAERNRAAIVDAAEHLLAERQPLNMAALAAQAGVSRPTLYSHFKTLPEVVEATVERVVAEALAAVETANPDEGPADEVVKRMLGTSWTHLTGFEAVAQGAAEYISAEGMHRTHMPLLARTLGVVERGQREGVFRTDLPAVWLVRAYYALVHSADEMARSGRPSRKQSLAILQTTVLDLLQKGDS